MNNEKEIRLPLGETVKRSFLYFIFNFRVAVTVTAFWFSILIVEAFTGTPGVCSLRAKGCEENNYQFLSLVLMAISTVSIFVAYSRAVILKEEYRLFHMRFGLRELKIIGYRLLVNAVPFLALFVLAALVFALIRMLPAPEMVKTFTLIATVGFVLTAVFVLIELSRISLLFSAIAIDNPNIRVAKSWEITRGNANKIFWGGIVMGLPSVVILVVLAAVYNLVTISFTGDDNLWVNLIFAALLLASNFLTTCLNASYYSHVYQYFVYFYNKNIEDAEARAAAER